MGVSKVEFGGNTLVDLTGDTVTEQSLLKGYSSHNKSGELIEGAVVVPTKVSELENDRKYLTETGNSSSTFVTFEQATQRANIQPGDDLAMAFGKLAKYCADLKPVAFSNNYTDLDNKPAIPSLTNSLLATKNGTALDAVQGKVLNDSKQDKATAINTSNIGSQSVHYANSAGSVNWNDIIGRPSIANAVTTITTETKQITINASSMLSVDLSFSSPIGFSAIGVVAVNSNTASSAITRFMIISNNVRVELRNMTSGQQNITISASVLCKNNG